LDVFKVSEKNYGEIDSFFVQEDFKLLTSHFVCWRPFLVFFLENFALSNYALEFIKNGVAYIDFFADKCAFFVLGVVRIPESAVCAYFEFQKLMTVLSFMTDAWS